MHKKLLSEFRIFVKLWCFYFSKRIVSTFTRFENGKDILVDKLVFGRGKMVRPFIHVGMSGLFFLGIVFAPMIATSYPGFAKDRWEDAAPPSAVLSAVTTQENAMTTIKSEKPRAEIFDYTVQVGDTVSDISKKFGISVDTIRWANDLATISSIKPGQTLKILPVTGVAHKVKKGDTVFSIAKYYSTDAQGIVDFPFNTFANDENFVLVVGQILLVPDGVMPKVQPWSPSAYVAQQTPNAGTVTATGNFAWPTSGRVTQSYRWYHKGVDIANHESPAVLAADAGVISIPPFMSGGYGNYVTIDHGNGYVTLYGHMSKILVTVGQTVKRGDQIGIMGSTGRSTGTHLHFEIRRNGSCVNPSDYLK